MLTIPRNAHVGHERAGRRENVDHRELVSRLEFAGRRTAALRSSPFVVDWMAAVRQSAAARSICSTYSTRPEPTIPISFEKQPLPPPHRIHQCGNDLLRFARSEVDPTMRRIAPVVSGNFDRLPNSVRKVEQLLVKRSDEFFRRDRSTDAHVQHMDWPIRDDYWRRDGDDFRLPARPAVTLSSNVFDGGRDFAVEARPHPLSPTCTKQREQFITPRF